jgi:hypothetical protein
MPLIVVAGKVLYRRPKKDELPVIGSMYFNNQIRIDKQRKKHCLELTESMSLLQKVLLKGKNHVV